MRWRGLLLAALSALSMVGMLQAEPLRVCVEEDWKIPAPARASLFRELNLLFPRHSIELRCGEETQAVIRVRSVGEQISSDILGRALKTQDGIAPSLEIFAEPLLRYTQANCWESFGRALARVAGHELVHFLLQSGEHADHGLFQPRLSPEELTRESAQPFLLSRANP